MTGSCVSNEEPLRDCQLFTKDKIPLISFFSWRIISVAYIALFPALRINKHLFFTTDSVRGEKAVVGLSVPEVSSI
jgi:hypothetical protein